MDQITLVNGRFSGADAGQLLTQLVRAKIIFHEGKIKSHHGSEEHIKHSENRIKELEAGLRQALTLIRDAPGAKIDLEASISISVAAI